VRERFHISHLFQRYFWSCIFRLDFWSQGRWFNLVRLPVGSLSAGYYWDGWLSTNKQTMSVCNQRKRQLSLLSLWVR